MVNYTVLKNQLEKLFEECGFNDEQLKPANILHTNCFAKLNCTEFYLTLHDLQKLKPIYINDILKNFYGFKKNTFQDTDYFYYFLTVHPSKYGSLLDSVLHFKKGGHGYLDLEYKLKNQNSRYEKFIGSTKTIFVENKALFAVTLMMKTKFFSLNESKEKMNLTHREREIVAIYYSGKKVKEVAEDLCISEATVKVHLKNVYHKLGIKNSRELFLYFES